MLYPTNPEPVLSVCAEVDGRFFLRVIPLKSLGGHESFDGAMGEVTESIFTVDLCPHLPGVVTGIVLRVEAVECFAKLPVGESIWLSVAEMWKRSTCSGQSSHWWPACG